MMIQVSQSEVNQNAFWVQYTSLILIVLTFIIAVSFAPGAFKKAETATPRIIPQVGMIELSNIFKGNGSDLDKKELEGLSYALLNHDLNTEIYIYGDTIETSLARSIILSRYLINRGIPAEAISSYAALDQSAKIQAKVFFYEANY